MGPPQDDFYIHDDSKPNKQDTVKSKKSYKASLKSKMNSSNLSDLLEAPAGAPISAEDDFIIEAEGGPTDADELAGKKTKSSSDKI